MHASGTQTSMLPKLEGTNQINNSRRNVAVNQNQQTCMQGCRRRTAKALQVAMHPPALMTHQTVQKTHAITQGTRRWRVQIKHSTEQAGATLKMHKFMRQGNTDSQRLTSSTQRRSGP